ncbi:sporulation inhibitor of replication protein SirA [Heyndrickxia acidiproducens]|uniref:sporulation inhibitor of replication protein SirA n=1 Tax=Heyndrickxia acidiproducens TaxID=1121084 RepID=UPI00037C643C|nr:sporulation inhibitor of replication protein SirA [Heyndrickxia acidiproducens]
MRTYYIYLIEDEIAEYYYGRERMFYDLFQEYLRGSGHMKKIIRRQIHYITKPIPVLSLHVCLQQSFPGQSHFTSEAGAYQFKSKQNGNDVEVNIEQRMLKLVASGSFDTETIIFEGLRNFNGNLLAIDYDHQRYGWMKPIKERKYV